MKINISIIRDISAVMSSFDAATVHVIDENVLVSHQFGGHNIVTWFIGNGAMQIYEMDEIPTNIESLDLLDYALYDTHWNIGGDCSKDYINAVQEYVDK